MNTSRLMAIVGLCVLMLAGCTFFHLLIRSNVFSSTSDKGCPFGMISVSTAERCIYPHHVSTFRYNTQACGVLADKIRPTRAAVASDKDPTTANNFLLTRGDTRNRLAAVGFTRSFNLSTWVDKGGDPKAESAFMSESVSPASCSVFASQYPSVESASASASTFGNVILSRVLSMQRVSSLTDEDEEPPVGPGERNPVLLDEQIWICVLLVCCYLVRKRNVAGRIRAMKSKVFGFGLFSRGRRILA